MYFEFEMTGEGDPQELYSDLLVRHRSFCDQFPPYSYGGLGTMRKIL